MDTVLQHWLIERLGPDCVPEEEDFYKCIADGTLLAQLLHSYGIIDTQQKDKIQISDDPWTRLENLKSLMPYFRVNKIKVDEYMLLKVTKEDQGNCIRLLYKLYTKMEPVSTLRLEVKQKEKEMSGKYPPRFMVSKVYNFETSSRAMTAVNPLITPLKEKSNIIAWHRTKYEEMLNILKENRKRISIRKGKSSVEKGRGDAETCDVRCSQLETVRKDMELFAKRYNDEEEKDIPMSQLLVEQVRGECLSKDAHLGSEKIRDYIPYLRKKIKRDEVHHKIKKSIEKVLVSEALEKLTGEQESEFYSLVTKKVLKQSQYEKQILSKLHDIRDEKMRIIKNRKFVQNLIFKETEVENESKWMQELTVSAENFQREERKKQIEIDYQRKLDEEKMRLKKEECTRTCTDAISAMIDAAIKTSDFVAKNEIAVPQKMWDEWKVLFIKSKPIFEVLENIEDILEPQGDEDFEAKREIESRRQAVLDEADFVAYMEMKGPWLLEDLCPELGVLLEPQTILGYIVYRILDSKYPTCPVTEVELPPATVAVCLIGLEDEETLDMLQSLLEMHQIQILQLKNIIEYFVSTYQEELFKIGDVDENLIIATERTLAELAGKKYEPPEKTEEVLEKSQASPKSSKDSSAATEVDSQSSEKKSKDKKKGKGGKEKKVKESKKVQLEDKNVQTDDENYKVELTPHAILGKKAFETLAIGERIDDALMTRMIVEYIKYNEWVGWVLLNYPENYAQAKLLEEALVGFSLPTEDEAIETLEILEGIEVRGIEEYKPMKKKGCSRLVPNTYGTASCDFPKSYLTAFITLVKQSSLEGESQTSIEHENEEHSEAEQKSVHVMDNVPSEKAPAGAAASVTFSALATYRCSTSLDAGISKIPSEAPGTEIKTAESSIRKKHSVDFEAKLQQSGEDIAEEAESDIEYEETGEGSTEEYKIGQEIEEEEKLCPLDKFYLYQGISYKFYYEDFDLQTLKDLARMIIGNSDDVTKGSVELFGKVVKELEGYLTKKAEGKKVTWTAKKLVSPKILAQEEEKRREEAARLEMEALEAQKKAKAKEEKKKKGKGKKGKKEKEDKKETADADKKELDMEKASEEEWSGEAEEELQEPEPEKEIFMNFYIPQELLVTLATLWENLEEVYIKDFKEAFFMKRIYDAAIYPYAAFVKNSVLNLIKGADNKQMFVHEFQMQFNAIEEDLRSDVEMKSELHARVYELRMALYDIADGHKFEVESERLRIIRTNWVTEHMAAITNIFLLAIQLEADRFVDTLQVVQDYYMGMLDKPPEEGTLEKVMVTRIELASPGTTPPQFRSEESLEELFKEPSVAETGAVVPENDPETLIKEEDLRSSSKNKIGVSAKPSSVAQPEEQITGAADSEMKPDSEEVGEIPKDTGNTAGDERKDSVARDSSGDIAKMYVEKLLTDVEADTTDLSPFHSTINETVESITTVMDSYVQKQLDIVTREQSAFGKSDKKGKKWKDRDTSPEAELKKAQMMELHAMSDQFFQEWRTVIDSEGERAKARLQLILKKAYLDLDDIIEWAKSLFHGLHEQIATRYKGEIAAIDELCKVICTAIEDERQIQEELVIDGDEFFTRPYVLMFPRPSPEESPPVEEPYLENTFRVEQLRRLFDIFRLAAPSGLMPERALCYILEDLIMCRYEEHQLPPMWYQLTSSEIPELLEAIFGTAEYVEWREFIIRALGLSYPTARQVLKMLEEFQKYDKNFTEYVSSENYKEITLWFEKNVPEDEVTQLHIRLAKELLFDMFKTSESTFGYMTFLLNFCKDEDPRRGLGKAFALKMGKAVVATEDDYKVYQQVLAERQKELDEAGAAAKEVMLDVTDDAVQTASGIILKEIVEQAEKKVDEPEEDEEIPESVPENAEDEEEQEGETEELEGEDNLSDDRMEVLFKKSLSSGSTQEEELRSVLNAAIKIPAEVIVNVLTTSLPWHGKAENVLEAGEKSLLMKLDQVFDEVGDENSCIMVHEFLSHKFIRNLFYTTHKFHAFRLEEKVESIFMTNELLDTVCDHVAELVM